MQLEQANVVLRPRSSWEAIDLGFRMARRWYRPLWLLWIASALPLFAIVHLFLYDSMLLAIFVFWWLKPLFEPLLTAWLGRALFNVEVPVREQLRGALPVLRKGLIGNLIWRRLFPSRSFYLCVQQLEGLHGERYRSRLQVLENTNPNSGWMTILVLHMEMVLGLSVSGLILMLLPDTVDIDLGTLEYLDGSLAYAWFNNLSYLVVASLIAPFYVAAGFSLYINSRTELEAWDIEIAFRRMTAEQQDHGRASRPLRATAALMLSVLLAFSIMPAREALALDREDARQSIADILAHEDFGKKTTVTRWEAIQNESAETSPADFDFSLDGLEWLAGLLKIAGYIALGLLVGWLIIKIVENIREGGFYRKRAAKVARPQHRLLQDDECEEPLPEDPVHAVAALCDRGELRKAMSLLYRATLLRYIKRQQIEIPESATEGECLLLVRQARPAEESSYFSELTRSWQWLAYAGERLPVEHILQLCHRWPAIYHEVKDAT